jgi:preprotein translocase subunit SecG
MLYVTLTIIHIFVCIFLSLVVLLQSGKGQDLASSFGGGSSQTVFGSAGPATALSKATTISAIIFMATSLGLAILSAESQSVLESTRIPVAPVTVAATPLPVEKPGEGAPAAVSTPASVPAQDAQPAAPSGDTQPTTPSDQGASSGAAAPSTTEPSSTAPSAPAPGEGASSAPAEGTSSAPANSETAPAAAPTAVPQR